MTEREEFVRLGWCLLERKCAYYEHENGMPEPPPDSEYDRHERRYLELAERLKLKPTAHCVGFPGGRRSARLVRARLLKKGVFLSWPERASAKPGVRRRTLDEAPSERPKIKRKKLGFF